jgi:hypothetical protein
VALTLGDLITAARDRSPSFTRQNVPHAVVARYLTGLQRRYLSKIAEVNAEAYAQQASVVFALAAENAIGLVGAGSAGGLPASLIAGQPGEVEVPAGSALEMDFDNAQILVPQTVLTGATATTLVRAAAGWVVNAYAGRYVWITDGPGIAQRREILSNTSDTLTLVQAWATIPTPNVSLFEIVNLAPNISEEVGVVTALPADATRTGYLVRLNASGIPYIDLTKPLLAKFGVGIDLPPAEYFLGGAVRFVVGDESELELRRYGQRWTLGVSGYGAYIIGGKLFLIGEMTVWGDVASIDLRYVPIAPALTALTDFLLLDDTAYDCLVARAAQLMANRVNGLPDVPKVDLKQFTDEAVEAELTFLTGVGRVARTFPKYVREVW